MEHLQQFQRFAAQYGRYNIIQKQVAKELVQKLPFRPKKILDLGCGDGAVYNNITWEIEEYIACDSSEAMLALHPEKKVKPLCASFDSLNLSPYKDHFCLSSSALQWSRDLEAVFAKLSSMHCALSLFTSGTFQSLHACAGSASPIYAKEQIVEFAKRYFPEYETEVKQYRLGFASTLEMLRYIKRSGVSGGKKQLSYSSVKCLLDDYEKDYLEFEVVFITPPQIPAAHEE